MLMSCSVISSPPGARTNRAVSRLLVAFGRFTSIVNWRLLSRGRTTGSENVVGT